MLQDRSRQHRRHAGWSAWISCRRPAISYPRRFHVGLPLPPYRCGGGDHRVVLLERSGSGIVNTARVERIPAQCGYVLQDRTPSTIVVSFAPGGRRVKSRPHHPGWWNGPARRRRSRPALGLLFASGGVTADRRRPAGAGGAASIRGSRRAAACDRRPNVQRRYSAPPTRRKRRRPLTRDPQSREGSSGFGGLRCCSGSMILIVWPPRGSRA